MTFGDKPRHDGEAGTTQSVRLWNKASLFSILSITHRSKVQLMQSQRRWKDNLIVYNFCVDTMVKFRIMKEHGVFLRWIARESYRGQTRPGTRRVPYGARRVPPQTGFQVLFLLQHGPEAYKYPRDPQGRDILHYTHIFELLERARVSERRLKREDQPRLAKGKSSSRRLGFP